MISATSTHPQRAPTCKPIRPPELVQLYTSAASGEVHKFRLDIPPLYNRRTLLDDCTRTKNIRCSCSCCCYVFFSSLMISHQPCPNYNYGSSSSDGRLPNQVPPYPSAPHQDTRFTEAPLIACITWMVATRKSSNLQLPLGEKKKKKRKGARASSAQLRVLQVAGMNVRQQRA